MSAVADLAPANDGPVGVNAKEVQRVVLLQRRMGAARLILGPFLALYVVLLAVLLQQYIQNQ
jgi:hypothetical protein